ncbi:glycosyltransferase family A protein [Arthrobacter sp. Br18]|uniref:glycosyltransferase n=1 Tax=Arthrobacter sp. Br18 TaxID=1312954 RepID=UPI0004B2DE50|nr:glycosyltransferase family A protein [Arthrobacter sp. Br18]
MVFDNSVPSDVPSREGSVRLAVVVPVYNEPLIQRTLDSLYAQDARGVVQHYVVDNGSTDDTRLLLESWLRARDDFPLTILEEGEKGTGAASDTGFRRAIADGYTVIARTDGDSVPSADWTTRLQDHFKRQPTLQLAGGTSVPLDDHYYRWGDDVLMSSALHTLRVMMAVGYLNPHYLKFVAGHNMAARATAYEAVGGFARTAIDQRDEDIDFSVKVSKMFGRSAICIDPQLTVATSMRRVRKYGLGMMGLHHIVPQLRGKIVKTIDVR